MAVWFHMLDASSYNSHMLTERGLSLDEQCREVPKSVEPQANLGHWRITRHLTLEHTHHCSVLARYLMSRGQCYSVYSSLRVHLSLVGWYGWLWR